MMVKDAIYTRRSYRQYYKRKLEVEVIKALNEKIDEINKKLNYHIQLVTDEEKAFSSLLSKYGNFKNVSNYIALIAPKKDSKIVNYNLGYYGEELVLFAETLGLNTCWVAGTYSKKNCRVEVKDDEKLYYVISIGYGNENKHSRKSKTVDNVLKVLGNKDASDNLKKAVEAMLYAPTAMNQQKFLVIYNSDANELIFKNGIGPHSDCDLGITKCHFDLVNELTYKENVLIK